MNAQTTLDAVRELSEQAMLRPSPTQLRLTTPEDIAARRPRVIIPWEERHALRFGGAQGTAGNYKPRKNQTADHCQDCGKRPQYCFCKVKPKEKDFLTIAAKKAESATERRTVVIPKGF
jgi:hypothetical protein